MVEVPRQLASSGRALEDAFFRRGADRVRERLRAHGGDAAAETTAGEIPIDAQLIERLGRLGIGAETLTALTLIPLAEVVWADGVMEQPERLAVLAGAEACGMHPGTPAAELLSVWLDERPGPELLEVWRQLIGGICAELSIEARLRLQREIVGRARDVAESAGGVMGFGAVSREEERVLTQLEGAFRLQL